MYQLALLLKIEPMESRRRSCVRKQRRNCPYQRDCSLSRGYITRKQEKRSNVRSLGVGFDCFVHCGDGNCRARAVEMQALWSMASGDRRYTLEFLNGTWVGCAGNVVVPFFNMFEKVSKHASPVRSSILLSFPRLALKLSGSSRLLLVVTLVYVCKGSGRAEGIEHSRATSS